MVEFKCFFGNPDKTKKITLSYSFPIKIFFDMLTSYFPFRTSKYNICKRLNYNVCLR